MGKMSTETQERVQRVFSLTKVVFRYGFIPYVLYLGFKKGADEGMPELSLLSLVWQ